MAFIDLIRKLFGRPATPLRPTSVPETPAETVSEPDIPTIVPEAPTAAEAMIEPRAAPEPDMLQLSAERRNQFWASVGEVESDVLAHLISPGLMGGPAWPTTRQAYRVVRRANGSIVIATDGLSDPFDNGGGTNGFGLELFVESSDLPADLAGAPGNVAPLARSWMLELLRNVAATVANAGGIEAQLNRYGALSTEVPGVSASHAIKHQVPASFVTDDDAIGALIGGPAPDFGTQIDDMPLSPIRIVPVVLLTAAELQEIRAGDGETRNAMVARLAATSTGHRCDIGRLSVV